MRSRPQGFCEAGHAFRRLATAFALLLFLVGPPMALSDDDARTVRNELIDAFSGFSGVQRWTGESAVHRDAYIELYQDGPYRAVRMGRAGEPELVLAADQRYIVGIRRYFGSTQRLFVHASTELIDLYRWGIASLEPALEAVLLKEVPDAREVNVFFWFDAEFFGISMGSGPVSTPSWLSEAVFHGAKVSAGEESVQLTTAWGDSYTYSRTSGLPTSWSLTGERGSASSFRTVPPTWSQEQWQREAKSLLDVEPPAAMSAYGHTPQQLPLGRMGEATADLLRRIAAPEVVDDPRRLDLVTRLVAAIDIAIHPDAHGFPADWESELRGRIALLLARPPLSSLDERRAELLSDALLRSYESAWRRDDRSASQAAGRGIDVSLSAEPHHDETGHTRFLVRVSLRNSGWHVYPGLRAEIAWPPALRPATETTTRVELLPSARREIDFWGTSVDAPTGSVVVSLRDRSGEITSERLEIKGD